LNQKRYGSTYTCEGWNADAEAQVISQIIKHDPALVAMDANVSPDVLKAVIQHCNAANITSESLETGRFPWSRVMNIYIYIYSTAFL
jgi:hypothetical protein